MTDHMHENPYQSFGQSDPEGSDILLDEGVQPAAPRVIGVLNIIFGVLLGLCGLCQGIVWLGQSAAAPQMQQAMQQQQDQLQQQLGDLQVELDAADEEGRPQIQEEIDALNEQIQVVQNFPDPTRMWGLDDSRVIAFFAAECVVALLLNLLMFTSGVGLLGYREWARKLAVWVAGLKIANLIVVCIGTVVFLAPAMAQGMEEFIVEMAKQDPNANLQVDQVADGIVKGVSVWSAVLLILGSVYPVICIWQLNRSDVKRWCRRARRAGEF